MSGHRIAVVLFALLPCVAVAQEIPWQAERVMLRGDGVRAGRPVAGHLVRQGKELPADGAYTVLRADGGLLELGDNLGWVARADVVRLAEATAYFTARIKGEPTAAKWYGRRAVANKVTDIQVGITSTPNQSRDFAGSPGDALKDLETAVRLAPDDTGWRKMLVMVYCAGGKYDKASEQCDAIFRLAPNDVTSYTGRACLRMVQGDKKGAVADSERGAELDPKSVATLVALAAVYHAAGESGKARQLAGRALELPARTADDYNRRAMAHALLQDHDPLLVAVGESLRLDPAQTDVRMKRAGLLRMRGEYRAALADIRQGGRLCPTDPVMLRKEAFLLATCKEDALRDGPRALELAGKAVKLCGGIPDQMAFESLAAAYAELGNFPAAVAAQKRAIQAAEGKPEYYDEITDLEWWLKQYEREQPRRE